MRKLEKAKSILTLKRAVIDKLNFERFSDDVTQIDEEGEINFHHSIEQQEQYTFRVSLGVSLMSKSKYNMEVQISGIFTMTEDSVLGKKILLNNTIAILFPYLRSQLTLLSSQPGFEPVILPVMNINALLNDEK